MYALAESPREGGVLWAGTDDGKLWVTEDDGGTWTDLTDIVPAGREGELDQQHRGQRCATRRSRTSPSTRIATATTRRSCIARRTAARRGRASRRICRQDGPVKVVREDSEESEAPVRGHGVRSVVQRGRRALVVQARRPAHRGRGRHPRAGARPRPRRRDARAQSLRHRRCRGLEQLTPEVRAEAGASLPAAADGRLRCLSRVRGLERQRGVSREQSAGGCAPHLLAQGIHAPSR